MFSSPAAKAVEVPGIDCIPCRFPEMLSAYRKEVSALSNTHIVFCVVFPVTVSAPAPEPKPKKVIVGEEADFQTFLCVV